MITLPRIQKALHRRLVDSAHLLRYGFPDLRQPSVSLSRAAHDWLHALRRDGIAKIEIPRWREAAIYLETAYFERMETLARDLDDRDLGRPGLFAINSGEEIRAEVSFKDPVLFPLLLDPDLTGVCYNYFRRQPFYRNQPVIQKLSYRGEPQEGQVNTFHVDSYHQLSFMLLISDQSIFDTHMEYLAGSHRRSRLREGIYINRARAESKVRRYRPVPCVGERGTLFVFDANGVHRRCLKIGNSRKVLHCNLTSGFNIKTFRETSLGWPVLDELASHSRRTLSFIHSVVR